jgi:hypothetical protein
VKKSYGEALRLTTRLGARSREERGEEIEREERKVVVLRASAGLSYVSPTTTRSPSLEAELPADSG